MQADLGFIRNKTNLRTRSLIGAPGNVSNNNLVKRNSPKPANVIDMSTHTKSMAHSFDQSVLEKRCEYLESQEKLQREVLQNAYATIEELKDKLEEKEKVNVQMYSEMQWIYGKSTQPVQGVASDEEDSSKVMQLYQETDELVEIADTETWVMLVFPMHRVTMDGGERCFMRMKTVDPSNAQLGYTWVLVYENVEGTETNFISKFAMTPF